MSSYRKYRIVKKVKESNLVVSLYLEPEDDGALAPFKPGQHLLFKIHLPGHDVPAFRYYSFSDSYDAGYYRVSVKKEPPPANMPGVPGGLCSSYLYDTAREGDILEAKGPSGEFSLDPAGDRPVVLIAGGIGITPLLSMIKSLARENPARIAWLFYGVNERNEHSFFEELKKLRTGHPNFRINIFYNRVQADDIIGDHYDYEGFVKTGIILQQTGHAGGNHYICGPPVMIKIVSEELIKYGVAAEQIYTEAFDSALTDTSLHAAVEELSTGSSLSQEEERYTLDFTLSGKRLTWDNRYSSILEFSEANDIEISSGCLFGDCGTCLTKLLQGEIKYTHQTMARPDAGSCLPCSCIPLSNLVLMA